MLGRGARAGRRIRRRRLASHAHRATAQRPGTAAFEKTSSAEIRQSGGSKGRAGGVHLHQCLHPARTGEGHAHDASLPPAKKQATCLSCVVDACSNWEGRQSWKNQKHHRTANRSSKGVTTMQVDQFLFNEAPMAFRCHVTSVNIVEAG